MKRRSFLSALLPALAVPAIAAARPASPARPAPPSSPHAGLPRAVERIQPYCGGCGDALCCESGWVEDCQPHRTVCLGCGREQIVLFSRLQTANAVSVLPLITPRATTVETWFQCRPFHVDPDDPTRVRWYERDPEDRPYAFLALPGEPRILSIWVDRDRLMFGTTNGVWRLTCEDMFNVDMLGTRIERISE